VSYTGAFICVSLIKHRMRYNQNELDTWKVMLMWRTLTPCLLTTTESTKRSNCFWLLRTRKVPGSDVTDNILSSAWGPVRLRWKNLHTANSRWNRRKRAAIVEPIIGCNEVEVRSHRAGKNYVRLLLQRAQMLQRLWLLTHLLLDDDL